MFLSLFEIQEKERVVQGACYLIMSSANVEC